MARDKKATTSLDTDPRWYKNAIIYELHVRAFHDSNADGIGDLRGLTQKLDYLRDLGITVIWLLPFYPSPLKDDGYDIADYYAINPIYGTLADFKLLLREAHERGLRVVTELVVNHTSDQHPWFQRARRAPAGSSHRNYYVWSDDPKKYKGTRIIFKDFEPSNWTWDPVAKSYYWHRFYHHQPDLNFDNPQVHKEVIKALDYWFDMGVDGLRLDAVPYLYEREGTSCENLPETHAFLKKLRAHVDEKYGDRMLLAEANQWPEDAVNYFGGGKGDECHMGFHFPLMPRLFMAVRMEDRVPIVDILDQTPQIPETSQWALFLRNHDELTLEMVTDEERDYMYRVYAHDARARINLGIRRRLAPLLGNDRKRIELLNLLLLSMPGTPVLYYGDEIGMGDNTFLGDRNGVRTPMQWSSDKNAGFSRVSPQGLYLPIIIDPEYHYETINVEAQQSNPHSLLWWTRRVLSLRKRWKAFGQGTMEFLQPENRKVLAFIRRFENETMLVVANLSRFTQPVELDLSTFKDTVPVELFGRTEFPRVTEKLYFLTLSPHAALWFNLEPRFATQERKAGDGALECARISVRAEWDEALTGKAREKLEPCLASYIQQRRWFAAKGREIKSLQIRDVIPISYNSTGAAFVLLNSEYTQGDPEEYLMPIAFARNKAADNISRHFPEMVIATLDAKEGTQGILHDATASESFCEFVMEAIARRRTFKGAVGELEASASPAFRAIRGSSSLPPPPSLRRGEQSNTSIMFGDRFILKIFRRLEVGVNPDLEIGEFLTRKEFTGTPPVAAALEYRRLNGEILTVGILTGVVPDAKDAWPYTLDMLGRYFERVRTIPEDSQQVPGMESGLVDLAGRDVPSSVTALIGTYIELARLLGQRTGELHLALGSDSENKDFAPEPFTPFYQRSLYQSMRNFAMQNLQLLRRRIKTLPDSLRPDAERLLSLQDDILKKFRAVYQTRLETMRIRCHGDFHLGQVLYTGKDFVIIDFEGEPARPLGERRIKRSPLRDIAGMIRSFDYATYAALFQYIERGNLQLEQLRLVEPWTRLWYRWVSAVFLKQYLAVMANSELLPKSRPELGVLLDAYLLEKAIYEIGYELNNRPDWIKIPLQGVLQLLR
jgi:maltose alpha-D-glucosyltransferase/alpha-amylase